MTNSIEEYQSFNQDGLELVINTTTGEAFASQRATARMLNIAESTLRDQLVSRKIVVKTAKILTASGLQGARLVSAQNIFRLAVQYNTELADKMGEVGTTVYLYGLAGYEVKPTLPASQPPSKLSISATNVQIARDLTEIQDSLSWNPRLAQFLIDQTIDQCFSQNTLSSSNAPIKGAAEIAESLGLPVNLKNRSALGRFLAKQGHEILKEERLCNGQMREVNCYRVTPEVEASVRAYFD